MKSTVVILPFDLFGSSGTSRGAELLADGLREILADNRREKLPTRTRSYTKKVRIQEISLDSMEDFQDWRNKSRLIAHEILERGDFLIWISGNHLGALPVLEELGQSAESNLVVQLDAHFDIYNLSDSKEELTHGNFLLHADGPLPRLINVGNRELLLKPEYTARFFCQSHSAAAIATHPEAALNSLQTTADAAESIFLDIDCDVFDPQWFPAVTHPVPFGLSSSDVLRVMDAIPTERLIGLCISEFDPGADRNDRCLATLLWLLEFMLLKRFE